MILLVAAFDAQEGYARFGLASTARWLTHACGLSRRATADHVRVARALAAFPALAEAMSRVGVVLAEAGRAPALRGDERAAVVVHLDLAAARAATKPRPGTQSEAIQPEASGPEEEPVGEASMPETPPGRRSRGRIAHGPG
ncbi:hypothetical protein [uncultured Jatrophihabitans sp.]|uniref:hypothetical protein n=1 Tax=uncultured Jatrophihabitans sp. TaxID=1610747 RepID=UPI0035C9D75E